MNVNEAPTCIKPKPNSNAAKSVFHLRPTTVKISARMEPPRTQTNSLTPSQQQAVAARGNVLVTAGAYAKPVAVAEWFLLPLIR